MLRGFQHDGIGYRSIHGCEFSTIVFVTDAAAVAGAADVAQTPARVLTVVGAEAAIF